MTGAKANIFSDGTKKCTCCGERKQLSDFRHRSDYPHLFVSHCNKCVDAKNVVLKKSNPELLIKWRRGYRRPDRFPNNLTEHDYLKVLESQNGGCAICGTTEPGANRKSFCFDHDHATGQIRGLLCVHCNLALGKFKDDLEYLRSAIRYLEKYV